MIRDETFYKEVASYMDLETRKIIDKFVNLYEEVNYLTIFDYTTSYFYGRPKVHKSEMIIKTATEQNSEYISCKAAVDLKFRPIVVGPNSTTPRLSQFMDLILKPLCHKVSSFIRDDIDFLHSLPDSLPDLVDKDTTLVTFDVVSLYTNIPHQLGIEEIQYWLRKYRDSIDKRFIENFIVEAMKIILERNVFYYDGIYYDQIKGTAMGTKVAPTYATLVLGYLEEKLYVEMEHMHGIDISNFLRENFKIFLDDCFIAWTNEVTIHHHHWLETLICENFAFNNFSKI